MESSAPQWHHDLLLSHIYSFAVPSPMYLLVRSTQLERTKACCTFHALQRIIGNVIVILAKPLAAYAAQMSFTVICLHIDPWTTSYEVHNQNFCCERDDHKARKGVVTGK